MRIILRLLVAATICTLVVSARGAAATSPPQCPVGQVPNWNNSACMAVQNQPSLSGYGIPTQQNAVPQGGLNGAPAMHNCNGIPVPLTVPCSNASPTLVTQSVSAALATVSTATPAQTVKQPSIVVTAAGTSPTNNVPDTTPATAVSAPTTGSTSSTVAPTPPVDATAALSTLLGSWYTGWIQYIQTTLGLSDATIQQMASGFAAFAPCTSGQVDACETAIWQQLSKVVGPAATGS